MAGPLTGIRIIDATQMISGPFAAGLLGDQGADVIKVEPPGVGDPIRYFGAMRGGMSALFATSNRNKRSVVLDVKNPADLERLHALVATADVFMQNFRPGAAERIGLGEQTLRGLRPDLIYVSISGFGEHGPYVEQRVYDPVIQALSGMATLQGDKGPPHMVRTILPDKLTAITAAQAIAAALFARERNGRGDHVRLAMIDAMVAWLWPDGMWNHTLIGEGVENKLPGGFNLVFQTADGYITAGALTDKEWAGLAHALGHPEWVADEQFKTIPDRVKNIEALLALIAAGLRDLSSAQALKSLREEEVPCAPILNM
ncbi:MAG: CaiB/BaiF CoA transferase family protein, partial [Gammaproteobacteria bacterium]